ncbi:hydantoinase/oxoprolinase family protein [Novipirellula artificiosorum]|uniref:Hydantoinase/oxoprolinase n=1 Tax=Novipirellula artificiosorum TaxID=2528016 RepID=A0A5C6DQR1_9BACT|nr:hydantoinase/oxoprolinase family protein [Novipirellula artificiosorum]TWU37356.1 Hydantoinase/oxoprolinase [Novipirellula artificiosorum]
MTTLGIDVGGAHLKLADDRGNAHAVGFALWQHPEQLADRLRAAMGGFSNFEAIAVVMTGELADCFVDRAEGVRHIVDHVRVAAAAMGVVRVAFYGVDGRFRDSVCSENDLDLLAAANWHALASFVGHHVCRSGLLIDIGSTTTDIIPIVSGQVVTSALTDYDRLSEGSLVYVGCQRTPVCALCDSLTLRGRVTEVMNEVFSTIDDARIVLGLESEDRDDDTSADGKPRTKEFAANRLARMIGLDRRSVSLEDAEQLAKQVVASAKSRIASAIEVQRVRYPGAVPTMVLSGHGLDLLTLPRDLPTIMLPQRLGSGLSRCAPAYAVATLFET